MRILVHDYAGHPFQIQLSRELASLGHDVMHCFSASFHTPKGELERKSGDPSTLTIRPIQLDQTIPKYSFMKRFMMDKAHASGLVDNCDEFRPDVVLSANSPSIVQDRLARYCQAHDVRLVSWIQDMYGLAAYRILKRKLPILGHAVGRWFMSLDRRSALRSDRVVLISEDFEDVFRTMGVAKERIETVHNWAPLNDLPVGPRDNSWSSQIGLSDKLRFVYAGTLSIRHNPDLLLQLAKRFEEWGGAELIVVSEGAGAEWLREQAAAADISTLRVLPFQPFEVMDQVFASGDVLLAILEPDAGVFCVPSKVLSYMCAQRPLLVAIPSDNLAARIVQREGAGLTVEPTDTEGFVAAAQQLYESAALRKECGDSARRYAEERFDMGQILSRFCDILGLPRKIECEAS